MMLRDVSAAACFFALSLSCAHSTAQPPVDAKVVDTLRSISISDWSTATPDRIAAIWPKSIAWGSEANGESPCQGSATFSYLGEVVDNDCRYCDTFTFAEKSGFNGKCDRLLSLVTITRSAATNSEAQRIAMVLLGAFGGTEHLSLPVSSTTRVLADGGMQVSSVEVVETGGGWRIRLTAFRTESQKLPARGE